MKSLKKLLSIIFITMLIAITIIATPVFADSNNVKETSVEESSEIPTIPEIELFHDDQPGY